MQTQGDFVIQTEVSRLLAGAQAVAGNQKFFTHYGTLNYHTVQEMRARGFTMTQSGNKWTMYW